MAKAPPRNSEAIRRSTAVGTEAPLQVLTDRARRLPIADEKLSAQRSSFAIGSATLSSSSLTRSSIAELASQPEPTTNDSAAIEVSNLTRQYDFVLLQLRRFLQGSASNFDFNPDLVREIHRISFDRIADNAGQFRTGSVAISGSSLSGPPADRIANLVQELCDYVSQNWTSRSALHLSAYVLWRLLWIHPFLDGNGRVARAASYLVLSAKLGTVLPGTPTLPELISQNRSEYYSALEAADEAEKKGRIDVSAVEEFIGHLLTLQLQNLAFLPASTKGQLDQTIGSRILRASEETRVRSYGTSEIRYRLWSQGPYLLLHAASSDDMREAQDRQLTHGDPFPGLLSTQRELAARALDAEQVVYLIRNADLDISHKCAFYIVPDNSLALIDSRCRGDALDYQIRGAVYCVRLGPRTTIENCDETFGLLIARHLRASS